MKYAPLICLILLVAIYASQYVPSESTSTATVGTKLTETINMFKNSFDFSNGLELITTLIILIGLWTGYKYWFKKLKYIKKNSRLLEKLVIVSMLIIFTFRHIKVNSPVGAVFDWILFLSSLYLIVAGTWFLAKTIDGIDLSSDLYCWGLRIIGGITILVGILFFTTSSFAIMHTNSKLMFDNIYWILAVCITLLGVFMQYRSFRRHPAIHVW